MNKKKTSTKVKKKPVKAVKAIKPKKEKILKRPRKPVVVCILTGQTFKISMSMLESQSKKLGFKSVQEYVEYYVSKDARKLLKEGYTDIEIRHKHNCKDRKSLPHSIVKLYAKKIKNRERAKKRAARKVLNQFVEDFINDPATRGKYVLKPKTETKFLDMTNPDDVAKLTYFSCARPHIFLDNGRNCKGCNIYELCKCPIKKMK